MLMLIAKPEGELIPSLSIVGGCWLTAIKVFNPLRVRNKHDLMGAGEPPMSTRPHVDVVLSGSLFAGGGGNQN